MDVIFLYLSDILEDCRMYLQKKSIVIEQLQAKEST